MSRLEGTVQCLPHQPLCEYHYMNDLFIVCVDVFLHIQPALVPLWVAATFCLSPSLVLFTLERTYHDPAVPLADLVSSGLTGLRLAASRYDPAKGTRFSTAATTWIGQHMQRSR